MYETLLSKGVSLKDILVVIAQNKGKYGTQTVNNQIQLAINSNAEEKIVFGNTEYRIGDPIIQCVNDYESYVYQEESEWSDENTTLIPNGDITAKNIYDVVNDSVKHHMIANVEVGTFLSGGIDSTIVTALAANINPKIKSFSIGFDVEGYNELTIAKKTAEYLGIENISVNVSEQDYIKALPSVAYYMDNPLADPSCVGIYLLSKEARKHVKVVLSGEGSDELFGGYNIYHEPYSVSWYYKIPYLIRRFLGILVYPFRHHRGFNFIYRRSHKLEDRYVGNAFMFEPQETKKILSYIPKKTTYKDLTKSYYEKTKDYDDVTKMQYIDFNFWLIGDILLKADKMSMANSLEVRVPFLDRILIDNARRIPTKYKIKDGKTKYLFREIAHEVLPEKWSNKKKLGFPVPIREWLKEDDTYNLVKEKFEKSSEFFKPEKIIKLLDEHKSGKKDNSRKIWTIFSFLTWYDEYFVTR